MLWIQKNYYSVYGCGLGYHIYQLYLISRGSVPIKVFDINSKMVEYARLYGVLEWIPKDVLEIRTDDSVLSFPESLDNSETGMFFHIPSVRQIKNEIEREASNITFYNMSRRGAHIEGTIEM